MRKTITIFVFTILLSVFSYAQTVHQFYVQDMSSQGYDPFSSITVELGDQVMFLNGAGGTYNFEIQDQNNQPNFEEPGIPNGQVIYQLTIDNNYPNYNEITVSEYIFNPSFINTVEIIRSTNTPPVLSQNGIYDRHLQTGATLNFMVSAYDAENDALTFDLDASSLNKGMTMDLNSGIFTWLTDVNGSHDGVHTVTIIVSDGIDTDSKSFQVTVGLANTNELTKNDIVLYPNPANEVVSISAVVGLKEFQIISAFGQLVYTGTNTKNIDVSELKNGIYIIKCLLDNKQVVTERFIKN